jgi:hypothetical protein
MERVYGGVGGQYGASIPDGSCIPPPSNKPSLEPTADPERDLHSDGVAHLVGKRRRRRRKRRRRELKRG